MNLLKSYQIWGKLFVSRLNGKFSIAIYDKISEELLLYRDRVGESQLYFYEDKFFGKFVFASDIKIILETNSKFDPNYEAIAHYFSYGFIPQPITMFDGIYNLDPGHFVIISKSNGIKKICYWDFDKILPDNEITKSEIKSKLLSILDDSTRIRISPNHTTGVFSNGCISGNSIIGLMSSYEKSPIKTFSTTNSEANFEEGDLIKKASKRFGTKNFNKIIKTQKLKTFCKNYLVIKSTSYGFFMYVNIFELSNLANRKVKTVLTGIGGHELFS